MKMIRRFLGMLMAAALLAGLLPADVLAAPETYDLKIKGVQVTKDNWMDVLHDGVFRYQYNAKTLVIEGDCTLDDDGPAAMIESGLGGLTIYVEKPSTLTLKKSDPDSCIFRLSGDTTIKKTGNTPGALTLVNEGAGGTGILADNCALTLQSLPLETRDLTYGIRGLGSEASLTIDGASVKIPRQKNASPPVTPNAAVSGFMKGIELLKADLVIPEGGKILGGAVCGQDKNAALDLVIQTREWDEVFAKAASWEMELSTLGEYDSKTGTYTEYDIDLAAVFNSSEDPSKNTKWNRVDSVLIVKGSVPEGMELAPGETGSDPGRETLLLKGRPVKPGTYELWLTLFGQGLIDGGHAVINNRSEKVILTVKYESNLEFYDLWIDGMQADNANQQDILGDGAFSYAPDSKTLTIRKSYVQDWSGTLIRSGIDGLIVDVPEDVTLSAVGTAFRLEKNTRFRGEGKLTVKSAGGDGIKVSGGAALNLRDADLSVEAKGTAVAGSSGGEKLSLGDLHLYARGGGKAVAGFSGGITLYPSDSTLIKTPAGGKISGGCIVRPDDSAAPEVEVITDKKYGLSIAGVPVKEENRKDVLGDGVFSFDGEKTLTVKGDCTFAGYIIENVGADAIDGLTIVIAGDAILDNGEYGWARPICSSKDTTITGPGSLTLRGPNFASALDFTGTVLTIKNLDLTLKGGDWGAVQGSGMASSKLIVENASVNAVGGEYNSAVNGFSGGIELIGCQITDPAGGKVSGGKIISNGGSVASKVTISRMHPVSGVTLKKSALTLAEGGSETLTASVSPQNATLKTVTWKSSDPTVATVDGGGTVTAVSEGTAIVTVRTADGGKTASCKVTVVPPVPVTMVELDRTKLTLPVGNYDFLTATVSPANATMKSVSWQSSDPGVVSVNASGKVTGVSPGEAVVTVRSVDGGKTAKCEIKVVKAVAVTAVTLNKSALTLPLGGSETLTPSFTPKGATNKNVTWSSSKPSVAAVNNIGKVTAVSEGTAKITVKTADGGKTASCTVTVQPQIHVTDVKVNMKELTLVVGQSPFNKEWLKATVFPENATKPYVTWTSDNPAVAGVAEVTGEVYAIKEGTANITVTSTDGGKKDTCKVTVIKPVFVTGVSLDPSLSLFVGESKKLAPVFKPSNATNKLVIWTSSDDGIAKVDSYGVVTGKSEGTAAISGQTVDGGKTMVCAVTVMKPNLPVTGVSLDRTEMGLTIGGTKTLTATVAPAGAADKSVTWSSSKPAVATVNSSGKVTAVSAGTAVITVKTKDGGKTAACTVTVKAPVSVTGVSLNRTEMGLTIGGTKTLTATVTPVGAANKSVTWSSSKPAVATVDNTGKVTAVSAGTAVITVKTMDGGKTAVCTVKVTSTPVSVTGVKLDMTLMSLVTGTSGILKAIVSPADATNDAVSWTSSKPSVATVDNTGKVTAVSAGTATITVKTKDGEKTAACNVTVTKKEWSFDKATGDIIVTGAVKEDCPVIVASYSGDSQFLGAVFVTKDTSSVVKDGAYYVNIFWVDKTTFAPKCPSETVVLS